MNNNKTINEPLDDCAADAALYVLGALPQDHAQAFEQRVRSGCPFCCAQAEAYANVVEQLAVSVTPVAPRPELRQRLLDSINARDKAPEPSPHMQIVRGSDAPWIKMPFPGVEMRHLIKDQTLMVRMQPGAVFPTHDHPHAEQCLVLEGSITDSDGTTLYAGDFVVMSGGIKHAPLRSETGCTLFVAYAD